MSNLELKRQMEDLFRKTGSDHHQAFIETSGDDPEWPLWYAEYLAESIGRLLKATFTKSELVYLILAAEKERAKQAPNANWPAYYTHFFIRKQN